ncbi:MAG: glutamate-5-semialdehyde dehydrogenase, partial [Elusimicrobiota bacterium]
KSGNAILLRGGTEAINTNHTLVKIIAPAAYANGIPQGAIQFVETTDREAVQEIIRLSQYLDLIIPRGGKELIRMITDNANVPVITHGEGVCHLYVDAKADLLKAENIAYNAKCQRPGVCNALECLLVHSAVAGQFLPVIAKRYQQAGVEMRGDPKVCALIPQAGPAGQEDWGKEFLSLVLAMKVVGSLEEALEHIALYGSGHSDAIITEDEPSANRFLQEVDSAAVYHNASTRFTDGGEFGLGAEIGISTQKLHARGPMGLKELTTYKYVIRGYGQIRE